MDYPESARAIALFLDEFTDRKLPYADMIADAARKAHMEIERLRENQAPDWMVIDSFRYCLGRRTYQVQVTVSWLLSHWDTFSEKTKLIITKGLVAEFKQDDIDRIMGRGITALGGNADREMWGRLLDKANRWLHSEPEGEEVSVTSYDSFNPVQKP